jgi:hypothetical protein
MKSNSSGSPILVPSDELPVGTTEHRKTGSAELTKDANLCIRCIMSDFSSADSNFLEVKPILGELMSLVIKSRGSFSVRDTFQELVTMAFNNSEFWKSENMDNFYFDGIIRFPTDKPILNLHVDWFGRILKHIVICVDIVPAVSIPQWIPAEMSSVDMTIRHQTVRQDSFFLLFQPPEDSDEFRRTYVRI